MAKHILVVDDDPHIREIISFALEKACMQCQEATNGEQALLHLKRGGFDLIVLDISMPEMDGLEVCKTIRHTSEIPILFLSSRDDEVDRIIGLEIGGDDYLTKPFSPRELVARVNSILKRTKNSNGASSAVTKLLKHNQIQLDPQRHTVRYAQRSVDLTATEFAIMQAFLHHPEQVFDRNHIMVHAYSHNTHVSDRTIDSHIRHIRNKFDAVGCKRVIETVHSVGYKLGLCQ